MSTQVGHPFTFTQTIGGWARNTVTFGQTQIFNGGTLCRVAVERIQAVAQRMLGQHLGNIATAIIVAVSLATAIYSLYKMIQLINSCCCNPSKPNLPPKDDDKSGNQGTGNENKDSKQDESKESLTPPPSPSPFTGIDLDTFKEGEEHYNDQGSSYPNPDPFSFVNKGESGIQSEEDDEIETINSLDGTDYEPKEEIKSFDEKTNELMNYFEKLSTSSMSFSLDQWTQLQEHLIKLFDLLKEIKFNNDSNYIKLDKQLHKFVEGIEKDYKTVEKPTKQITEAFNGYGLPLTKKINNSYHFYICEKQLEIINSDIEKRYTKIFNILRYIRTAQKENPFNIHLEIENNKRQILLSILNHLVNTKKTTLSEKDLEKAQLHIHARPVPSLELHNLEKMVLPSIEGFENKLTCKPQHCSFVKALEHELSKEGMQTSKFLKHFHKNITDSISNACKNFEILWNETAKIALTLNEELKKKFPDETPTFDEKTGTVTASAEMLLYGFGLAKKNPDFQVLASLAFDYKAENINQKGMYARLVQMIIYGMIVTKDSKNSYCETGLCAFKVKEIEQAKISTNKDTEMTKHGNSYAYTQLMMSKKKTMQEKFEAIIEQYVKDFCGTRPTFDVTLQDKKPYPTEPINGTVKNNEMFRSNYITYLKTLSQEALAELISNAKESDLFKEALKAFPPTEEELKTSDFPLSVLEKMFSKHLDNPLVRDTLNSTLIDPSELNKGLPEKEVEPLLRYKLLEHLCFRSQAPTSAVATYPFLDLQTSVHGLNLKTLDSSRTLDIKDNSFNSADFILGTKIFELNVHSEPIDYALTTVRQTITNINKNSSVEYSVFNDVRVSCDMPDYVMTLLVSKADPKYLSKIQVSLQDSLKEKIRFLDAIQAVKGGGSLIVDKNTIKAKDGEGVFIWITGFFADYTQPDINVLEAIKNSLDDLVKMYRVLNQHPSESELKQMYDSHGKDCRTKLGSSLHKLFLMCKDQTDQKVREHLIAISNSDRMLSEILTGWEKLSIDKTELQKQQEQTDDTAQFFSQMDEEKIQETYLSQGWSNVISFVNTLYEGYSKRFISSTDPKDISWKTAKYDAIIYNIQNFIVEKYFNTSKQTLKQTFGTGIKSEIEKIKISKSSIGKALTEMLEALAQMKVDPKNRPVDHETLGYQGRIRGLFQNFFIALEKASEEALKIQNKSKNSDESIDSDQLLDIDDEDDEDSKYADMVFAICHQFFTQANLKDEYTKTLNTFYDLNSITKESSLTATIKEAYEGIQKADSCRKTPVQDSIFKSLKGHLNITFNGWYAGNPVSQWFKMTVDKHTIDMLAFGSPTNENSPSQANILQCFIAAMKEYENNKKTHLYVSLQNMIPPVEESDWSSWFGWTKGWFKTILGGDETNRIKALMKVEDECSALYFMNLSMNSTFYKHPVSKGKVDILNNADNFKKKLFAEIFTTDSSASGNYISKKVRDAYKEATKSEENKEGVDIEKWAAATIKIIHENLFIHDKDHTFAGTPKSDLTEQERQSFIEIFYELLTSEVAQKLKVNSMNESCKDDIDRGIVRSALKFIMDGIANGLENDPEFIKNCTVIVNSRALNARQREIIHERLERILQTTDFALKNKDGLKNVYKALWGDITITSTF